MEFVLKIFQYVGFQDRGGILGRREMIQWIWWRKIGMFSSVYVGRLGREIEVWGVTTH